MKLEKTVESVDQIEKLSEANLDTSKTYTAKFDLANGGEIKIELDAKEAPYTVSNFVNLARNHFYDGKTFHRVISSFMAQGGCPNGDGRGGPGYQFHDEQNTLKNTRGAISMANAGPNTNGSQFFICFEDQPHLNGKHTVFGKVTEGMNVVDEISQGQVINKVEIFEE